MEIIQSNPINPSKYQICYFVHECTLNSRKRRGCQLNRRKILWMLGTCLIALSLIMASCGKAAITITPKTTATTTIATTTTAAPLLATSAKDIVGTWVGISADKLYQRFNSDGTCQTATSLDNLATKPDVESTFRFEGTHFILTEVAATGRPSCSSQTGTYEIQLLTTGTSSS